MVWLTTTTFWNHVFIAELSQSRIKLIGMIGSYNPEALSILDKPVITSSFPFRSSTNPFCVGDRVQILQRSQLDGATAQVLDPSEDFGNVLHLNTYI